MDTLSDIKQSATVKSFNEKSIILSCKKDIKNFSKLYDKYYVQIFRYIYQRVEGEAEAKDICSQVFLKAMQNIHKYKFKGFPFSSWLYTIARNEMNLLFREQKYRRVINVTTESLADMLDDSVNSNEKESMLERLGVVLNDMAPKDLELIEMRYFEGRPFAEISEILNMSVGALKVKVSRLIKRLRKEF